MDCFLIQESPLTHTLWCTACHLLQDWLQNCSTSKQPAECQDACCVKFNVSLSIYCSIYTNIVDSQYQYIFRSNVVLTTPRYWVRHPPVLIPLRTTYLWRLWKASLNFLFVASPVCFRCITPETRPFCPRYISGATYLPFWVLSPSNFMLYTNFLTLSSGTKSPRVCIRRTGWP